MPRPIWNIISYDIDKGSAIWPFMSVQKKLISCSPFAFIYSEMSCTNLSNVSFCITLEITILSAFITTSLITESSSRCVQYASKILGTTDLSFCHLQCICSFNKYIVWCYSVAVLISWRFGALTGRPCIITNSQFIICVVFSVLELWEHISNK